MPLSPAQPREHLHTRTIECHGYRREDGLWEVEGRITDVKTYAFDNRHRGRVLPGTPVHDMSVRLTLDDALTVTRAEASSDAGPFAICPGAVASFATIEGLKIGPGWNRAVRSRLGGRAGCTHIVDLLGPVATSAYQMIFPLRQREGRASGAPKERPRVLDTCFALAADSPVVKDEFPDWYTGPRD